MEPSFCIGDRRGEWTLEGLWWDFGDPARAAASNFALDACLLLRFIRACSVSAAFASSFAASSPAPSDAASGPRLPPWHARRRPQSSTTNEVLNFRCGLSNYKYHGAVACVNGKKKDEIDDGRQYGARRAPWHLLGRAE